MRRTIINSTYLSLLCRELALMLHAGMPVSEGLLMLREDDNDPASRALMDRLCQAAEDGLPLSRVLEEGGCFPRYMLDMAALGERTGKLEETMDALSRYYEGQARMAASVRNAVLYPVILLVILGAVIAVLVTQVLPIFQSVFNQLGLRMSGPALAMMRAGEALAAASGWLGLVLAVVLAGAVVCALSPRARNRLLSLLRDAFGGRGVWRSISVNRFTAALSMAMSSGLDLEEAVDMAARVAGGNRAVDRSTQECRELILDGCRVGEALTRSGLLTRRGSRMLALAEQAGSTPEVMADIARRSEEEVQQRLDSLIARVEPTLVIVASAAVGVILLSAMLPLLSIMSSLG